MAKILDDEFLNRLPQDSLEGAYRLLDRIFQRWRNAMANGQLRANYEEIVESLAVFLAYCHSKKLPVGSISLQGDIAENIDALNSYFHDIYPKITTEWEQQLTATILRKGKERFESLSGELFCYKFSDDDITKIQACLDELWALISTSEEIAEDHRKRLLTRLEQLQEELHKKLSDLDRFWGLFGDAFTVMKKLGDGAEKTAKIYAAITTIAGIIYAIQNGAHGLPHADQHSHLSDLLPKLLLPKSAEHKTRVRAPIEA